MAGPAWLTDPSPQAKKRRQVAAIAGGALLALMLLMRGRATTPAGTANGDLQASSSPLTPASTFADNGAQAAGLGTDVTAGLGQLSTSLDSQQASFEALNASLTDALAAIPANAADQPVQAAPAAIAAAGKSTNTSKSHARNAAGAQVQTQGTRAGLRYTTTIDKGRVVRSYESSRGRGDFGKQRGSRIVIKKAPAKAAKPKKQTAARPKASTNRPHRSPSRPPAHHHAQPVHKKPHKKAHH